MSYQLDCPKCFANLHCASCGEPINDDSAFPGQVGRRHPLVAFDPRRRNAWNTQRGRILKILSHYHPQPLLAREMSKHVGVSPNQTCTRVGELCALGLVMRTGHERPTETNTPADEWVLTPNGMQICGVTVSPPPPPLVRTKRIVRRQPTP
jgi:hypothetical protein